ncbi:glycerophosphodiester phosphodiesterase family protein [Flavonifractor hominis]|uniref:Glycerophosphodiester phosphodiesterase family protein n=1 Tax=Flavonifractor hominis TaxID=3133178 RepID=A0ABV1ENH3_9FIRM
MRKGVQRALGLICSGALLLSALPVPALAAGGSSLTVTGQDALVVNSASPLRIDLGDASFSGEKTVTLSGYVEEIPEDYVTDGLVFRLDGLEGVDAEAGTWTSQASGGEVIQINRDDKLEGEGTNSFGENYLQLDRSKIYLPQSLNEVINSDSFTVEYFVDQDGYNGYDGPFAPILTVDEAGDSFSIFTRTGGEVMELKQGGNPRLQTSFDNAVGCPSAIVFQNTAEVKDSSWYADGVKVSSITPKDNTFASAEQLILGGRLGGSSYETQAKYYSIRIYDRALSADELKANATLDRSRFLGEEEPQLPALSFNDTALEQDGTTELTLTFENGVATLPVVSGALGSQELTLSVDGQQCQLELVTLTALEAAVKQLPQDAISVTVAASASDLDICAAVAEQLTAALEGTPFLEQGGSLRVDGNERDGFQAVLSQNGNSQSAKVEVNVQREESTDADVLKPDFQKVLQGAFSFDSAESITAQSIQEQAAALLGDAGVTPSAAWDEEAGCWQLTLTRDGKSATMPLYINSEVELSFDDPALMNYTTTRMAGGDTAYISGGALHVTGTVGNTYENVVLPVWNFDRDFCIEAEVRMTSAVDSSRWMAVSYGVRPNSAVEGEYTFRQMAVRQNATATNGVEFALMTDGESHGWNVTHTGSYHEAIDPAKTYKLTVLYRNGNIYEYINEELIIVAKNIPAEQVNGKIAFTFDRLTAEMLSLRVSSELPDLPTEKPEKPMADNGYNTEIYEPTTGLVMSPTVVSTEETPAAEAAAAERRPATLVRTVTLSDGVLSVQDGEESISLSEYMTRLDKKILAGFRIEDTAAAEAFGSYVDENGIVDVNVFSADPAVLEAACGGRAGVRGVLDFTGGMPEELIDVVSDTNRSGSRIALIPAESATREAVAYIQARAVNVWVAAESNQVNAAILAGADGLVVSDAAAALDAIEAFDPDTPVLTRQTVITAHRGLHQTAPENTERAAVEAVKAGADAIECDVHMTSDGYIVVNHDETTGRLMNENVEVAKTTLAELQQLTFNENAQEGDRIPTLEQLFQAADEADPDDDIIHVIEIKSTDPNLIKPLAEVIRKCNMEDRVIFISFSDAQTALIRQEMPEVSVGELNTHSSTSQDNATNLKNLSDTLDNLNAFYNCSYGTQDASLVRVARHRGIYVHPWTVDDQSVYEQEFFDGYHGITSNRVDYSTGYLSGMTASASSLSGNTGAQNALSVTATAQTRGGEQAIADPSFLQISGSVTVQRDENGAFWSDKAGTAQIVLGTSYTMPTNGDTYTMYSMPITLTFVKQTTGYDTQVYEPATGLVMSPTVVSTEETPAAEAAAAERRPATLVRTVTLSDGVLSVQDGEESISLSEYMTRLDKKILAGFRIEDTAAAEAFGSYVDENGIVDVNVFSTDPAVLEAACGGRAGVRGVLDFTGGMPEELIDVVSDTNRSGSRIALIPAGSATREAVAYIQARAVNVWVAAESSQVNAAILAGADGLVVSDAAAALDAIEAFDPDTPVLTRQTVITAHRGLHQTAPENTERAAVEAVKAGADAIECDVHMTSDGYIVVNHDETTGRLMNEDVEVAKTTLAELQQLTFNENAQEGDRIPTLEQLFQAADEADPDDDIIHVIEIKSTDPNLIKPLADVIRKCHMEDRVIFISFSEEQLKLIREEMPEVAVGVLYLYAFSDVTTNLEKFANTLDDLNAFYNCYSMCQTPELVAAARHRGIYVHPWTVDDQSVYEQEFFDGYHGITSNRVDYSTGYLSGVTASASSLSGNIGAQNAMSVTATAQTRGGEQTIAEPSFLQISGSVTVQRDENGAFWSDKAGTAQIVLGTSYTMPTNGDTYTMYSMPITLTFTEASQGGNTGDTDTGDTGSTTPPVVIVRPAFNDIANQWYTDAANYVGRNGIMSGVGGGRFDPNGFSSRAMVAQVIYNMEGSPATAGVSGFTDVLAGQWYTDAVTWNVSAKIVSGYGNGLFGTNDNVTREQLVVLLYRYAQYKGYGTSASGSLAAFVDSASVSDWATQAMSWAVANGIINGKDGARLDPQGTATRAEMAKILMTFCQTIAE